MRSRKTKPVGIMYSGRRALRKSRSSLTSGSPRLAATMCAISLTSPSTSSRARTTAAWTFRCCGEDVFDLLELDPAAADLHLMVEASNKLEIPVGSASGPGLRSCTGALRDAGRMGRERKLRRVCSGSLR